MIKSAENLSIEKLLGKDNNSKEVFYKIPPYQREWENLFNDINDLNLNPKFNRAVAKQEKT